MNYPKKIRKLISAYEDRNIKLGISKAEPLDDDKYRLKVKILSDTKVADIEKNADDIRRYLKLEMLEVVKERNAVYIIIAKKRSPDENKLINIWHSSEYADARKTTELAYPFAVDQFGDPVIIDFLDNRTTHTINEHSKILHKK